MRRFDQEWELLIAARDWLGEAGYELVESRGPEGMDQGMDAYVGAASSVRIVADRSQWFVDVRPSAEEVNWFSLESWSVCLGAPVLFHDPRPTPTQEDWLTVLANSWWLRPQLDYLREHIQMIEAACQPTAVSETLRCLSEARVAAAAFPRKRA